MCLIDHVGTIPFISRYHVQQQQKMLQQKLKIQVWPTAAVLLLIKKKQFLQNFGSINQYRTDNKHD
jgi:hypothetical protein